MGTDLERLGVIHVGHTEMDPGLDGRLLVLSPELPASQFTEPSTTNNRTPLLPSPEAFVASFSSYGSVVKKVSPDQHFLDYINATYSLERN